MAHPLYIHTLHYFQNKSALQFDISDASTRHVDRPVGKVTGNKFHQ
jgi:hypothetical protein